MAFLGQDDKQNLQTQNPTQQGGGSASPALDQTAGGNTTPMVGTGSNAVTGSPQPQGAAVGGGGTGWTNIQNYLTANQGNTGSSDILGKTVGDSFSQDRSQVDQGAQQYQSQAKQAGSSNYLAPDTASQLLSQASRQYNPASQSSDYQSEVSQLRTPLNQTYNGPAANAFNPVISTQSQTWGQALPQGDDSQFNSMMGDLYNKKSGQNLTEGQRDLQNVFAANDPQLQSTRTNLADQYNQLTPYVEQQKQATNQAIQDAQNQFQGNHQQLSDFLTGTKTTDQNALNSAVQNWNGQYSNPNGAAAQRAQQQLDQILGFARVPDSRSPNNTLEMLWSQDPVYAAQHPGFAQGSASPIYRTPDLNPYKVAGTQATVNNVPGMTDQRNTFNTIQDILQNGAPINSDPTAPQAYSSNYQQFINDLLSGANNTLAGERNSGNTNLANSFQPLVTNFQNSVNQWLAQGGGGPLLNPAGSTDPRMIRPS